MKIRVLETLVATVIALALALMSMPVSFAEENSGTCGDNTKWSFNQSTGTLTISGEGAITEPSWQGLISYNELKSLVIKDGVTNIPIRAFENCQNLANITVSDSVQLIEEDAFENTAFYNNPSNWENDVLYIGNLLIKANGDMTGPYTIKDGTTAICEYAFNCCSNLTAITIPESVTLIDEGAFQSCKALTSVKIPNSVRAIETNAFYQCESLENISMGDGIVRIGYDVFDETKFFEDSSKWEDKVLYIDNYLVAARHVSGAYTIKDGTKLIAQGAFESMEALTDVTIPDSVMWIGTRAFHDTGIYEDISNWENNVLYIDNCLIAGSRTYKSNYSYQTVCVTGDYSIKDGTRVIADYAFTHCENLKSVTIPESVKTIGRNAFWNCDHLKSVKIPGSVTSIETDTFSSCGGLQSVTFGKGVSVIDHRAFNECGSLSQVNYNGSQSDWNKISIGAYNDDLLNATKAFSQNSPADDESDSKSSSNSKTDSKKKSEGSGKTTAVVIIVAVAAVAIVAVAGGYLVIIKKKKS